MIKTLFLTMAALVALTASSAVFGGPAKKPLMLPAGYLSTRGSQIVDRDGNPVRIACIGGWGTGTDSGHLGYGYGPYNTLGANLDAVKRLGFNCLRVGWNDKCVDDAPLMADFDTLVAACKARGIKVILDHHNNEGTAKDWGNVAQQTNGLWFDTGPGSDGSDDSQGHPKGTITNEKFLKDWVRMAKRYAGNDTVIGCDIDNEPHTQYGHNGENWGRGGPCDIWAMYTKVGNLIHKVNPGVLIICQGFMDITDKSSNIWWTMDLTHVATKPVVLTVPHKVVYCSHEYPNMRNGGGGPKYVARLNEDWGYLVAKNIAPVWIGEMGASMDQKDGGGTITIPDEIGWANTLMPYMNGKLPGGIRLKKGDQPISGDWWDWGYLPGQSPDGCLTKDGQLKPGQKPYIEQMLFWPKGR